jgi:hypothetical protein
MFELALSEMPEIAHQYCNLGCRGLPGKTPPMYFYV